MVQVISKSKINLNVRKLTSVLNEVVKKVGFENKIISLSLVNDSEIQKINKVYRKKDMATDVISYKVDEDDFIVGGKEPVFGEIVISYETAREQAKELQTSFLDRVIVLFIHGLVHVLGYDHEKSVAEAKKMVNQEERLIRFVKKIKK